MSKIKQLIKLNERWKKTLKDTKQERIIGVKEFYTKLSEREWDRLASDPYHKLEFITTMHLVRKYAPKRGFVLDAGGGPGRYSIELAKKGYKVVLLDYTSELLEIAKRRIKAAGVGKNIDCIVEGSITDLSLFDDNTFDIVLSLGGPLSHILKREDREKAASELVRVAKRGAPIFASVMSRLGVLTSELKYFQHELKMPHFNEILNTGDYPGGYGFTECHFFLPEDLKGLFERRGAKAVTMASLEGRASYQEEAANALYKNQKLWGIWVDAHLKTCEHPSTIGACEHFMIIARKK